MSISINNSVLEARIAKVLKQIKWDVKKEQFAVIALNEHIDQMVKNKEITPVWYISMWCVTILTYSIIWYIILTGDNWLKCIKGVGSYLLLF